MNEKVGNNQYFATKSCFVEAIETFLYDTYLRALPVSNHNF